MDKKSFIKITKRNVAKYYYDLNGNLYYQVPKRHNWYVLDGGFTLEEVKNGMANGYRFIYIPGPALYNL